MPTELPKTLITWDLELLEEVTLAARICGESRSEWVRQACRDRLKAMDDAADAPVPADDPWAHRTDPDLTAEPYEEPA
jgi:hypothetical protein